MVEGDPECEVVYTVRSGPPSKERSWRTHVVKLMGQGSQHYAGRSQDRMACHRSGPVWGAHSVDAREVVQGGFGLSASPFYRHTGPATLVQH